MVQLMILFITINAKTIKKYYNSGFMINVGGIISNSNNKSINTQEYQQNYKTLKEFQRNQTYYLQPLKDIYSIIDTNEKNASLSLLPNTELLLKTYNCEKNIEHISNTLSLKLKSNKTINALNFIREQYNNYIISISDRGMYATFQNDKNGTIYITDSSNDQYFILPHKSKNINATTISSQEDIDKVIGIITRFGLLKTLINNKLQFSYNDIIIQYQNLNIDQDLKEIFKRNMNIIGGQLHNNKLHLTKVNTVGGTYIEKQDFNGQLNILDRKIYGINFNIHEDLGKRLIDTFPIELSVNIILPIKQREYCSTEINGIQVPIIVDHFNTLIQIQFTIYLRVGIILIGLGLQISMDRKNNFPYIEANASPYISGIISSNIFTLRMNGMKNNGFTWTIDGNLPIYEEINKGETLIEEDNLITL